VLFVEVRVLDENGKDVEPGGRGEVVYRSPQLCRGYWGKPEETAEAFTEDGWFRSGDLVRVDEEGYLYVVDRIKDVVNTGGVLVASREVEEALYDHPAVGEVAVIGLPHERWIEAITAVVVPKAEVGPDELIAYAKEHLAPHKVPKAVYLVDELPKNPSGKLLKRELRAKYGGSPDAVGCSATRSYEKCPLTGPVSGHSSAWDVSVGLDGRDLELQHDLVADQHAAGLQRGVPGDAELLAADRGAALEADPLVAERVQCRALEGQRNGHLLGDALDGQVTGDVESVLTGLLDLGGGEGDLRVLVQLQEVTAAQVGVTIGVARVDAVGLDRHRGARLARVGAVDGGGAGELVERAADLGDHRVPGHEAQAGVRGVQLVSAGQLGPIDLRCSHSVVSSNSLMRHLHYGQHW